MKRVFDFGCAFVGLLVLSPVFVFVALLVLGTSRGPALFRQTRVGLHEKPFTLVKFRTMVWGTPDLSTAQMAAKGTSCVTPVGKWLRRLSLDELPQLWNVLKGDMSLVGPRPALPTQAHLNALRKAGGVPALRPGITGWAQINGRDDLSDEEKAACDTWYIQNQTFGLDMWILLRTALPVFSGKGNR